MAEAPRTALQQLNDFLFKHVIIVGQTGSNKHLTCKHCNHNFHGNAGRIHEHLKCITGNVKGCSFSVTNAQQEVCDEIDALHNAVPASKKRKAVGNRNTQLATNASSSGLRQVPIQEAMLAMSKLAVDQSLIDWVVEAGIPFNVFRCEQPGNCCS